MSSMGCGMSSTSSPSSPVVQNSSGLQVRKQTKHMKIPHAGESESEEFPAPSLSVSQSASQSEADRAAIASALSGHFLFASLDEDELHALARSFVRRDVRAGEVVFSQGQPGDGLYVILSGVFAVYVDRDLKRELYAGEIFGDLALLYAVTRTATVSSSSGSGSGSGSHQTATLYRLSPEVFKRQLLLLNGRNQDRIMAFFASDDRFSLLPVTDRRLLASVATMEEYASGASLVLEDWLYVVMQGALALADELLVSVGGDTVSVGKGDVLGGDQVLFGGAKKEVSLVTKLPTTCLTLSKAAFETRLSPGAIKALTFSALRTELKRAAIKYKLTHEQIRSLAGHLEEIQMAKGQSLSLTAAAPKFLFSPTVALKVTLKKGGSSEVVQAGRILSTTEPLESVVAENEGPVFQKDLSVVHKLLNCSALEDVGQINTLKQNIAKIFLFKQLNSYQQDQVVKSLKLRKFSAGEVIVNQGDSSDSQLYLILAGNVEVSVNDAVIRTLAKWDYFGERALLFKEPRSATCKAVGAQGVECMLLDGATFRQIVGAFQKVLESRIQLQDDRIEMKDLEVLSVVGEGAFGKVCLVHKKGEPTKRYALKQVNKAQAVKNKQTKMLLTERDVLLQCNHPCIVQCVKTFKDKASIYFLTEFLAGGDLFTAMRVIGLLTKSQVRFYVGSILLAIEYLHQLGFIYKDLKPEQVMLDEQGFVKLVDMGCAKKAERTFTLIGTPSYLAPEVIRGKGYGKEVDYYSLGVVSYELICGPLPFDADDQLELFKKILEAPLEFPPSVRDNHAIDLISRLLCRDPAARIKADEIKSHPYFEGFSFDAILCRTIEPPYKPDVKALTRNWTKPPKNDVLSGAPYSSGPGDWDKDF